MELMSELIGNITTIKTGKLDVNAENPNGKYPFFTCSKNHTYIDKYAFEGESILVAGNGDLNVKYYDGKFNAYQRTYVIQPKKSLNGKYLYYFLEKYVEKLREQSIGGVIKYIKLGNLTDAKIPLPDLPTQQKIATILDKADELRQYNQQLIEKYDALTQSLFLDMFGDIVSNSKGWDKKTLKEISIRFSDGPFGSNLKTEHYSENGIQVIRLQNIGINKFNNNGNDKSFVNETHYNNVLKKYSCFPGDIVIATMGNPNIRACVIPDSIEVAVNKADCVLLRANPKTANQIYISCLLNLEAFLNLAISFIHGQTRSRISSGQLGSILVPIPPIDLQNQFAERVQLIETQKLQAQEALEKSEALFKGLLQQAFKGELN